MVNSEFRGGDGSGVMAEMCLELEFQGWDGGEVIAARFNMRRG
jgi:hypothetical protein